MVSDTSFVAKLTKPHLIQSDTDRYRYSGRPSPYYKESHAKLRNYLRKWTEEVCSLLRPFNDYAPT